jgi:spermidine/putrescine transport system substrate-binding protein
MQRFKLIFFLAFSLLMLSACTKKAEEPRMVRLMIWGNYFAPETKARFERERGIRLEIANYSSNEELLAKLQAGARSFDLAVPSDYMVEILAKQKLIQPLDFAKIPNRKNLMPELLGHYFDPKNTYSVPFATGLAGLAVNRDLYPEKISCWSDLLDNPKLAGKFSLLDDSREVIAVGLKLNEFSVNSRDPKEIDLAKKTILKARKSVNRFSSDVIDSLVNREVAIAHTWSVDAMQAAAKSKDKIEFVLPCEGGTRAMDNLVVIADSKNANEAHELIDFLLNPEVNRDFVQRIFAGPVLVGVREQLPPELKSNAALFPSKEILQKFEEIRELGSDSALYDKAWTELKVN